MKIESKLDIFAGVLLIFSFLELYFNYNGSHLLTRGEVLAPLFLGIYFIFNGIFGIIPRYKKRLISKKSQRSTKIPLEGNRNMLPMEERYYYKGKTNQQLHQYNEALQCYIKALEVNPDFEPAKRRKKKLKRSF